ncbi:MAG: glycosyltransferase family 2 protein [Anaerolineales bacterium]|nr:glycosyltransferase family 2 protein [Anaerolineales bacterium]
MLVSVIIPVYNGGDMLAKCLTALQQSRYAEWECIVVDDGSTDNSVRVAHQHGVRLISGSPVHGGPARARNLGAHVAQGDLLFFLDADVEVRPGTIGHAVATMTSDSNLAACFGSYDDNPTEQNFLSQYRNLMHHYVHQTSSVDASTFWSGCGMIWRELFWEMGGFDTETYTRPSIEDIDLGYRLRNAGYHIRLEKLLQVRHMKRWTPKNMLITDIRDRALPWTRLILQDGELPNDMNLQTTQRLSTAVTFLLVALFAGGLVWPALLLLIPALTLLLIWLNRSFYTFLQAKRNTWFAIKAMPWHWLYFFYSGLSFIVGIFLYGILRLERPVDVALRPFPSNSRQTPSTDNAAAKKPPHLYTD